MIDASHPLYQTHGPDQAGMSDTQKKLARLKLPDDLTGKRVLDIGCNEGFFSHEAARRGAAAVIGIDFDEPSLEVARTLYEHPNVQFLHQRWDTLPAGPFDLVLWTSAMHYETDPASVMERILAELAPDGLLILECGFYDVPKKELVLTTRHGDTRWYPTRPLLESMLSGYAVRPVADAELAEGDPVPRGVFHCRPRKPVVMLIRGDTRAGKSLLAAALSESSTKVLSTDDFVSRIALAEYHHTPLQELIRDEYDHDDLGKIYHGIDRAGLTDSYAELLAEGVVRTDRLVVVEGLITDPQAAALTARLEERALVWDVTRRSSAPSLHDLAVLHGTDKAIPRPPERDSLAATYEPFVAPIRDEPVSVLEIGVREGASVRMWRDFFPNGQIIGIDIDPAAVQHDAKGITVLIGDQTDPAVLDRAAAAGGPFDLILDDGGHYSHQQIATLLHLWPHVRPGGIYVLEDTHTSYIGQYRMNYRNPSSAIELLKGAVDDVHARWHDQPLIFEHLASIHFFPETCILRKQAEPGERNIWAGFDKPTWDV